MKRRHHRQWIFRSSVARRFRGDNVMAPWPEYRPLTISIASPKPKHSPPWAMAGSLLGLGAALVSVFGQ